MSTLIEVTPDGGKIERDGKPFYPCIFDSEKVDQISKEYNVIKISLNAGLESDLKWQTELDMARNAVNKGLLLFWELDMGLFEELPLALSDTTQYRSLILALDQFSDLCWKEFKEHTFGVCIYRGSIDFTQQLSWDIEQLMGLRAWLQDHFVSTSHFFEKTSIQISDFYQLEFEDLQSNSCGQNLLRFYCRDIAWDYMELLIARLPDDLQVFLLFDVQDIASPMHLFQLLSKQGAEYIHLGAKGSQYYLPALAWEHGTSAMGYISQTPLQNTRVEDLPSLAWMIPDQELYDMRALNECDQIIKRLSKQGILFRPILEELLTVKWHGLNELLVFSQAVSLEGKRKLLGFCAAGGKVIHVGDPLGLSDEKSFSSWKKQLK